MLLTHHTPNGVRISRHHSLDLYGLPDDGRSAAMVSALEEIARVARTFTGADAATVNLLPAGRQVTLAATSPDAPTEMPERHSICATLLEQRPVSAIVVPDLSRDQRFADNPYVTGELAAVRGFVSAPLLGRERIAIGSLCAWWMTPRSLSRDETALLDQLARAAVNVLDDARRDRRVVTLFPERVVTADTAPAA